MSGWIGVDLDGTLAHYSGWQGIDHIGAPIAPMVERVKRWLAEGRSVKIFTARVDGGGVAIVMGDQNGVAHRDVPSVRHHIEQWCLLHLGSSTAHYQRQRLRDDRALGRSRGSGANEYRRAGWRKHAGLGMKGACRDCWDPVDTDGAELCDWCASTPAERRATIVQGWIFLAALVGAVLLAVVLA